MPDESDPPRKYYSLRPREFERVNQGRAEPPPSPAPADPPPSAPPGPVNIHEIIRMAGTEGPVLSASRVSATNEVHDILRANAARADAAGLNHLAPKAKRRSRRRRDYMLLMATVNSCLAILAAFGLHAGNVVLFVASIAGIGLLSASITWVMWFVMDDY